MLHSVTGAPVTSATKPAVPDRVRLNQLDSEELAIRNNRNLTPVERNQQLQRVWKEQREASAGVTGTSGVAPKESPAPPQRPPGPATSPPAQPPQHAAPPQSAYAASIAPKADEPKYATKVPGKFGLIKSPYDGKLLDATGVPPGTEVKDPSTGKIMLVP